MHITINNHLEFIEVPHDVKDQIKEKLTFDNPAYKNAKRYGRSRYISIPPYLTYYSEYSERKADGTRIKVMCVPIGFDISNLDVPITYKDCRTSVQVSYPEFKLGLREDQKKAEKAYLCQHEGHSLPEKSIIQLPTGKGKSILALHLAYALKQKVLILVHKDDLVVGWQKDIKLCFGEDIDIGLIKAKSRKVGKQITIATVQTLNRMSEEEFLSLTNQFGLVVQDECHHVGLNIFNIIDRFNSKYKLGLSATPKRSDGLNFVFDLFFGGICYKHKVTQDDEDISQVEVRVLDSPFKYKPFVVKGQVFNYYAFKKKDLPDEIDFVENMVYTERPRIPYLVLDDEAVRSEKTMSVVCNQIKEEYNEGHSILALFTQKEHIREYYDYLTTHGILETDIMCYYGDSHESSEDMIRRAEEKDVLVTLATYAKATEGTNVKSWEVLFLVSSLNNEKNVEQATGRIRRKKSGKINPVRVYDVRYGECYSLKSHYSTRHSVYRRLKYSVIDSSVKDRKKKPLFTRGYH